MIHGLTGMMIVDVCVSWLRLSRKSDWLCQSSRLVSGECVEMTLGPMSTPSGGTVTFVRAAVSWW